MSEVFKTITYTYIDSDKPDLALVLPQAMETLVGLQDLVQEISQVTNLLFVESGYFGISKLGKKDNAKNFTGSVFTYNLHELLQKFEYRKLFIAAGSIGCIQALAYLEAYPNEVELVAMAAPALYRRRGWVQDQAAHTLVEAVAHLNPDLSGIGGLFKDNKKIPWLQGTLKQAASTVGLVSYFHGLGEIIEFTTHQPDRLPALLGSNVHVFLGDNDGVFKLLCDEALCQQAASCETIPSGHTVLKSASSRISRLIHSQI